MDSSHLNWTNGEEVRLGRAATVTLHHEGMEDEDVWHLEEDAYVSHRESGAFSPPATCNNNNNNNVGGNVTIPTHTHTRHRHALSVRIVLSWCCGKECADKLTTTDTSVRGLDLNFTK